MAYTQNSKLSGKYRALNNTTNKQANSKQIYRAPNSTTNKQTNKQTKVTNTQVYPFKFQIVFCFLF